MKYLITVPALCFVLLLVTWIASRQVSAETLHISTRLAGIALDLEVGFAPWRPSTAPSRSISGSV